MYIDVTKIRHWNFDADDDTLYVCKGEHPTSDSCNMEKICPHEALKILNALRSECLRLHSALALAKQSEDLNDFDH